MNLLLEHRSIRKYTQQDVSDEQLKELIEVGCRASNTGNMQVYSIVITRNDEMKKALAPCHFNQSMVTEAPVVLTICADFNRFKKWCEFRNAHAGYDNFLSFQTAAIDAVIAAQNICIAAENKGLGICYLGTTIYNADKIIELLELPKGVVPITTITLGYPDEQPKKTDRLPIEAIIHHEKYSDYDQATINRFYSDKENLEENKGFVDENKKENLAQVFTDIRYTKKNNEHFSGVLFEVLKKQSYL